jgi:hypothetical protein
MGFRSFTEYVESLIRSDLADRPILIKSEDGVVFATHIKKAEASEVAKTGFSTKPRRRPESGGEIGGQGAGEKAV